MELFRTLKALLAYINGITGQKDTRLGEAIKRLAEGYIKNN